MDRQTERQNWTFKLYLCAYVIYLQDGQVYWPPLAKFTYNNSAHASTGVMLYFAEKVFHTSICASVWAILANGSVTDMPDTKSWAEKLVELWAAIKQYWKKVSTT
jgi:hypothetical protein